MLNEADFRSLFETGPALCLVLCLDAPRFTIAAVSDSFLRATRSRREQLVGRGIFEVYARDPLQPEADQAPLRASLERVLASGSPDAMATQRHDLRGEDGAPLERHWNPTNSLVRGEGGEPRFLLHHLEDVSGLVRDTARSAKSAQLEFRMLFDLMPQLGWSARPDGFIDLYNRRWDEYTGARGGELEGWGWERVHDPQLLPVVVERWQHSLRTGEPFEMEFPLRRKDGVFRWFLTRVQPVRDERGVITRWIGINTDIHDRKQISAESAESLRVLIDSIKDYAVFMLDPTGLVRTWNPGAERIKQYRADEIIGRHFSTFYPQVDLDAGKPAFELKMAAREGSFEDEGYRLRRDGSRFWAHVVISAMRGAAGELIGFSKVTRDLTERKRAEDERLRLAQTEEALKLRDEFLSIASHELKTPLNSLQLLSSSILRAASGRGLEPEKLVARTARLDQQVGRLTGLVNELLDVSRMSAGRLRVEQTDFELDRLLHELVDRLQLELAAARCELELRVEGAPLAGRWDRLRVERVLANLLGNALKYGAGKPIEVRARQEGEQVVVTVRDHGIGIAPDQLQRIFERFARAVPAEHYGGFGLGLWIAREFAVAMDGSLEVESAPGQGACFTLSLPRFPRTQEAPSAVQALGLTQHEAEVEK